VTLNELHASLAAASPGTNLTGLLPWLSNDAPPRLTVSSSWDEGSSTLSVTVQRRTRQEEPPLVPLNVSMHAYNNTTHISCMPDKQPGLPNYRTPAALCHVRGATAIAQ
jgi:hypothetical protein